MRNKILKLNAFLTAGVVAGLLLSGCSFQEDIASEDEAIDETEAALVGANAGDLIPGAYIVVLRDKPLQITAANYGQAQAQARADATALLARRAIPESVVDHVYGSALRGFSARLGQAEVQRLANDPAVAYIEQDSVVTLADPIVEKTGVTIQSQTVPPGITRVGGGTTFTGSGRAWIIDTGIDLDHPDLNVDVARSRTFVNNSKSPDDGNGHGSHVSGTIAAKDDANGVVGVAAGATVIAVQVLGRTGSGTTSGVIAGVDYVRSSGSNGDVANMSLGGGLSTALDSAVQAAAAAGVKFALAAGNSGADANNSSPGRVNGANIFTVSAVNSSDVFASFSNFGNPPVDFAAPGVSILSTYKSGGFATLSGTSMATPHVAGVLLFGSVGSDGTAINDPDGEPDPIAHR
jgi:subtilisin family serine protease